MALYDDSYEERQEDEVEFLQAVFPGDFEDLRKADPWNVRGKGVWSPRAYYKQTCLLPRSSVHPSSA